MWVESVKGGFSSSALAVRRVLALEQAYGIYLTDKRLIVTKENPETAWCWELNGASILGTVTKNVKPFLGSDAISLEELDKSQKKFDARLEDVAEIELKHPSFLLNGHIKIRLKSNRTFNLLLLNSTETFSKESFEAARELFLKNMPGVTRVT